MFVDSSRSIGKNAGKRLRQRGNLIRREERGERREEREPLKTGLSARIRALSTGKTALLIGGALALLLAVGVLDIQELFQRALLKAHTAGAAGALILFALYIVFSLLMFPALFLTIGAGTIFDLFKGSVLASFGAAAAEGWKIVFLTRLSPVFPFNVQNYLYGLSGVSFRDYLLASWAGMIPGTIMYAYIGSLAADFASLGGEERVRTPFEWALTIACFAATAGLAVYVARYTSLDVDVFFGDASFENGFTITVRGKKLRLKKAIIADAIRRAAGEWNIRRLTPVVAGLLARWLKFQRLDAMPLDAGTFF